MLKSVFCVDFTGFYCLVFEQNYAITKGYGPTLFATEMYSRDSSFQRYTTCADFRRLRCVKGDKSAYSAIHAVSLRPI